MAKSLASIAEDFWEFRLQDNPLLATAIGIRRYDDRLPDMTQKGLARKLGTLRALAARAGRVREGALSKEDRVTLAALRTEIRGRIDRLESGIDQWTVDPLHGPQVEFQNLESIQPVRTIGEGAAMVKRWTAMGPYFDVAVQNLARAASHGRHPAKVCVAKSAEQIRDLLAKPEGEWAFLKPLAVERPRWSPVRRREFSKGLKHAVKASVIPGYERYLSYLETKASKTARPEGRVGLSNVPGGAESYRRLVRASTSLDLTPAELHQTGLDEVARINAETARLGKKALGAKNRKETLQKLRSDRSLYFSSRDEVEEKARQALKRARAAIPDWFGRLPKADCVVVRMEEHEEKHSTIAYYRQPAMDGSVPGRYFINTSSPETRPRYEAEALAYHESIPGHHLQIAIAQELVGIPEFRKNGGVTAFVEGWGLYSERLADLMGLYSSDIDRLGMLSYDSWRACRLVVDTGMHAMGWSRQEAIDFMYANSALAINNIANEVDRYISWPGQALAYKTGQIEMLKLRAESERRSGDGFDIKAFHDRLLGNGALPLSTLREVMRQP